MSDEAERPLTQPTWKDLCMMANKMAERYVAQDSLHKMRELPEA